jgi:O-antigen/teichoic acid export membrane protein
MFRSFGIAYNEVVVALLEEFKSALKLWQFAVYLILITTTAWLVIIATPLSQFWFQRVSALPPDLVILAQVSIWFTLPMPAFSVLQSWYQGVILHSKKTNPITEAVLVYLAVNIMTLSIGVAYGKITGLYIGMASFVFSTFVQTVWLWNRSRVPVKEVYHRDELQTALPTVEML